MEMDSYHAFAAASIFTVLCVFISKGVSDAGVVVVSSNSGTVSTNSVPETDAQTLVEFRKHIAVDPSHCLSNWSMKNDALVCSSWKGVQCYSDYVAASASITVYSNGSANSGAASKPGQEVLTTIASLNLTDMNLTGILSSPLEKLLILGKLDVSRNRFQGQIPDSFVLPPLLQIFSASSNNFSGSLPSSLERCEFLRFLDFSENNLSGRLPDYLGTMKYLSVLKLGNNKLEGPIPTWISSLVTLQVLDLSNNLFSAKVPAQIGTLKGFQSSGVNSSLMEKFNLRIVKAIGGKLDETLRQPFFLMQKGLDLQLQYLLRNNTVMDLSNNNLTGVIPPKIGDLLILRLLNLSCNRLEGKIPSTLSKITTLEQLDLHSNRLKGTIPQELSVLYFLASFNVSNNFLWGRIPTGTQFTTFDESCYRNNSGLCGLPLPPCNKDEEKGKANQKVEEKEAKKSWFDQNVSLVGLGLGFGLGYGGVIVLYFHWDAFQKFFGRYLI